MPVAGQPFRDKTFRKPAYGFERGRWGESKLMNQDSADVGVDGGEWSVESEDQNSSGGIRADPRQSFKQCGIMGELSLELVDQRIREFSKEEGSSIVAESGPGAQQLLGGGTREREPVRPLVDPCLVLGNDPFNLRLLQHYLRDRNAIGFGRGTPG